MSRRFIITQIIVVILAVLLAVLYNQKRNISPIPVYGQVKDFKLINQDGQETSLASLKGKVWVADFIFTTCSGICPTMSKNMARLSQAGNYTDVRTVSISVNPENDTPLTLKKYAQKQGANDRWIFLTGSREDIQRLAVDSFKLGDMKEIIFHSAFMCLVDRRGNLRGYYDGTDDGRINDLARDIAIVRKELYLPLLPTINASLNGLAGICLLFGFLAIRRKG